MTMLVRASKFDFSEGAGTPSRALLAFQRMDHVRPASTDLAIDKARTAARLQRPTEEVEDNINRGRTAFVTAGIVALRGGAPIRVNGQVVGSVGIAGLSKETDTAIANAAAATLNQLPTGSAQVTKPTSDTQTASPL